MQLQFRARHVLECSELSVPFPVVRYATKEIDMWGNNDSMGLTYITRNLTSIDQTLIPKIKFALYIQWRKSNTWGDDFHYFNSFPHQNTINCLILSQYTQMGNLEQPEQDKKINQFLLKQAVDIETRIQHKVGEKALQKWPLEYDDATPLFERINRRD